MSDEAKIYRLFEVVGIELEYMIVGTEGLDVLPVADELLRDVAGSEEYVDDVFLEELGLSNELVLHVIELKTLTPVSSLSGLAARMQEVVGQLNRHLAQRGGRLMPTAMHPWMDPWSEMRIWPHAHGEIYEAYDRIFDCRGHGWANLQSVHVNLPFSDDEEFGRLHAALRLLLPIMPALAASSPVMDGRATGLLDNRMAVYMTNSQRVPEVMGDMIPEPAFSFEDYERLIFRRLYDAIAPHDPDGLLQHEWLNARGAIARFERNAFEVRVIDSQESVRAEIAIAWAVFNALRQIVAERWLGYEGQRAWDKKRLKGILLEALRDGERAVIGDLEYLEALGLPGGKPCTAGEVWAHLMEAIPASPGDDEFRRPLNAILERGTLARRILAALGDSPSHERMRSVYGRLCETLANGEIFLPESV